MQVQEIFDRLWSIYISQNPEAKQVYDSFVAEGEVVENDHIAFRTVFDTQVNADVIARPFLKAGYIQKGYYVFDEKHLTAKHYEHISLKNAPRVFISQLTTDAFSPELQRIMKESVARINDQLLFGNEVVFAGNLWGTPSFETYNLLRKESEYASWFYVYGFCANHFTLSINLLKKFNTIEKVNSFLKGKGFSLNTAGGEIKGTPAELLEQSSTKAGLIPIGFMEGTFEIPSCYYEFAKRYPDADGQLYSGFIAKSADKIFESTDFYKK